jgi:CBS-domain-containing membrane protein
VVASADAAPTRQARQVFEELAARLDELLQRLREVIDTDVDALNRLIREASMPAIGHVEVEK